MDTPDPAVSAEEIERLLEVAATNPVERGNFTLALLGAKIFVPIREATDLNAHSTENTQLHTGASVELLTLTIPDGRVAIPFFTSPRALEAKVPAGTALLEMSTRELFEVANGSVLVLNYGTATHKTFEPSEVRQLLTNQWAGNRRTLAEALPVQLRVPRSQPTAMFAAMTSILSVQRSVEAAYFGQIRYPDSPENPHNLIGLAGGQGAETAIAHLGPVAAATEPTAPTDFILIGDKPQGVAKWLAEHGVPWYSREST